MSVELTADVYDKLVGQTLAGRYLIEQRLGEGAMGAVYRAKHVKVGRPFAVKVLHPRLLEDKKVLARFEREAELAGRLRHPNVIGVVDVGETPDGMRYMVMDFAEGPDLASLLAEAPMPAERVMNLARQLCEGLFHAHEQGLIHRDFKPENVIVEKDSHGTEVPRIVDFGIAILREGGESSAGPGRLTTNGLVLGTPHYMAPEQAVADPIDHRIDLFALGIMVYEMLSGKLPFDGTGAEVARANLLLDPPLISERVPYVQADPLVEAFARRLMAKKRDQRPATAKLARDILDQIEKDRPAAAAALGVPLDAARPPQTTQEARPVPRPHTGPGTFPPPIREAEMQAPPVEANNAVAKSKTREHAISTQQTGALKRRKGPIIGAAIVGVGIIAGAAIVIFASGKKGAKHDAAQVASADEPKPMEQPAPPIPPVPAVGSAGSAQDAVAPTLVPPTPTDTVAEGSDATAGSASSTKDAAAKQSGKQGKRTTGQIKTATPGAGSAGSNEPALKSTPAPEVKVVQPPAGKPIDSGTLAMQYKSVGSALKALEDSKGRDAATDLWARYRIIRLSDAMSTQQKRDEASSVLSKLTGDIATRKR